MVRRQRRRTAPGVLKLTAVLKTGVQTSEKSGPMGETFLEATGQAGGVWQRRGTVRPKPQHSAVERERFMPVLSDSAIVL